MSEAEAFCERIAVIYEGRVVALLTLEELRALAGKTAFEEVFLKLISVEG